MCSHGKTKSFKNICHCHHQLATCWLPMRYSFRMVTDDSKTVLRPVSVSAMLVYTRQKNIAQAFILERYFFVSIYPAAIPDIYLAVFLVAALLLCL